MNPRRPFALLAAILMLAACTSSDVELRMVQPVSGIDRELSAELAALFDAESGFSISMTPDAIAGEAALDAIVAGEADIALVSNALPYREGVTAIIPLFPAVLHVGSVGERDHGSVGELLRGARVFAGDAGSASRLMFMKIVENSGLTSDDFTFVTDPGSERPDVFVVFAPIAPDILENAPAHEQVRLFSAGPVDDLGKGSAIDAATLLNPYLRPFVIPMGTYGDATPEAILTVAVDKMLVARRDLDPADVYNFMSELLRLRPALAARRPALFKDLTGDFDPGRSTFVLHPGAQAYLERSEPSFMERYSGVAEVAVTVFIGLVSAIFGGLRIYDRKRKNRIDKFYSEVLAIRSNPPATDQDREAGIARIEALQNQAFEQLVDEKLAADESFRIFITLSNDVLHQLNAFAAPRANPDN